MKCPYCKEEIENDLKVCPICGEKIIHLSIVLKVTAILLHLMPLYLGLLMFVLYAIEYVQASSLLPVIYEYFGLISCYVSMFCVGLYWLNCFVFKITGYLFPKNMFLGVALHIVSVASIYDIIVPISKTLSVAYTGTNFFQRIEATSALLVCCLPILLTILYWIGRFYKTNEDSK